jgi:thioredoxin 1
MLWLRLEFLFAYKVGSTFALEINPKSQIRNQKIKGMLYTNLKHILTAADHARVISENENVMVICGRMGPMCIPVYGIAEELEEEYCHVKFCDMEFDNPESYVIRTLPEVRGFMGIPFTIYYKNGKVVKATSSIQNLTQVTTILDKEFGKVAVNG